MPLAAPPTILAFAGFDPSGGAGIQADIETIGALGGHVTPIITAHTVQNTQNVDAIYPTPRNIFDQQIEKLRADFTFSAIKIGLLGDIHIASAIVALLQQLPNIPVILDPVLASGAGDELSNAALVTYIQSHLLPHATLITPNSIEARRLTQPHNTLDQCGRQLRNFGCNGVLITGAHEPGSTIQHRLYTSTQTMTFSCARLPHTYHGSGCTLAAAIAFFYCVKRDVHQAIDAAQTYTWRTLKDGRQIGRGQHIPNRYTPRLEQAST